MFKTIKSKLIFVIIFCIICIVTIALVIMYKKIDIDEVAINIQKEIDKKYYEKNKIANEIEKITSIKKDIDDLKNFYHTEYKINFPEEKINFQKKKSR